MKLGSNLFFRFIIQLFTCLCVCNLGLFFFVEKINYGYSYLY